MCPFLVVEKSYSLNGYISIKLNKQKNVLKLLKLSISFNNRRQMNNDKCYKYGDIIMYHGYL